MTTKYINVFIFKMSTGEWLINICPFPNDTRDYIHTGLNKYPHGRITMKQYQSQWSKSK